MQLIAYDALHHVASIRPFFTVALSYIFLGTLPNLMVLLTLVPIVLGVVIASATDLSFNWYAMSWLQVVLVNGIDIVN
jgi:solute carrier family 35 protein E1